MVWRRAVGRCLASWQLAACSQSARPGPLWPLVGLSAPAVPRRSREGQGPDCQGLARGSSRLPGTGRWNDTVGRRRRWCRCATYSLAGHAGVARVGAAHRRAGLSQRGRRLAVGRQASLPGAGLRLRLRHLPLFRSSAIRTRRSRRLQHARRCAHAGCALPLHCRSSTHRLDHAIASFACCRLLFGHPDPGRWLSALHVGHWLLRALLRWQLGARAADWPVGRGPGLPRRTGGVGFSALLAEGLCRQALLQLSLRLP